eukprot:1188534-Prorocentrum_minimum.AAC.1
MKGELRTTGVNIEGYSRGEFRATERAPTWNVSAHSVLAEWQKGTSRSCPAVCSTTSVTCSVAKGRPGSVQYSTVHYSYSNSTIQYRAGQCSTVQYSAVGRAPSWG